MQAQPDVASVEVHPEADCSALLDLCEEKVHHSCQGQVYICSTYQGQIASDLLTRPCSD